MADQKVFNRRQVIPGGIRGTGPIPGSRQRRQTGRAAWPLALLLCFLLVAGPAAAAAGTGNTAGNGIGSTGGEAGAGLEVGAVAGYGPGEPRGGLQGAGGDGEGADDLDPGLPPVVVKSVEGLVLVQPAGRAEIINPYPGMALEEGDRIITGRDGLLEISYWDGSITRLSPSSRLDLNLLFRPTNSHLTQASSFWGQVWNSLTDIFTQNSRYDVSTPSAVAGVRSTKYLVDSTNPLGVVFRVYQGVLAAQVHQPGVDEDNGDELIIQAGEESSLTRGAPTPREADPLDYQKATHWEKGNLVQDLPEEYVGLELGLKESQAEAIAGLLETTSGELALLAQELALLDQLIQEETDEGRREELEKLADLLRQDIRLKAQLLELAQEEWEELQEETEDLKALQEMIEDPDPDLTPEEVKDLLKEKAGEYYQGQGDKEEKRRERLQMIEETDKAARQLEEEINSLADDLEVQEMLKQAAETLDPETLQRLMESRSLEEFMQAWEDIFGKDSGQGLQEALEDKKEEPPAPPPPTRPSGGTRTPSPPPALELGTAPPGAGKVGLSYSHNFTAGGGQSPYDFWVTAGTLPPGLTLTRGTGALSGVPRQGGTYTFTVTLGDSSSPAQSVSRQFVLEIAPGTSAALASLAVTGGELEPAFDPGVTGYRLEVEAETESVAVTAGTRDPDATLQVQGQGATPGQPVGVPLGEAGTSTAIQVKVTAGDGETTLNYNIEVKRAETPPLPEIIIGEVGDVTLETGETRQVTVETDPREGVTLEAQVDNPQVASVEIDNSTLVLRGLEAGETGVTVLARREGYQDGTQAFQVRVESLPTGLELSVRDSVDGRSLPGVQVRIYREEELLRQGETGEDGRLTLLEMGPGTYTAVFQKEGYVEDTSPIIVEQGKITGYTAWLSTFLEEEETRIVLSWGDTPYDLDAHLIGTISGGVTFEIFFDLRSYTRGGIKYASLDRDVIKQEGEPENEGPETITIYREIPGGYTFRVHHFQGEGTLAGSGAVVRVYRGEQLVEEYKVPEDLEGVWWDVFSVPPATLTPTLVTFMPARGAQEVDPGVTPQVTFSRAVTLANGQEITSENAASLLVFKKGDDQGDPVPFTATVSQDKKALTMTPDSPLEGDQVYYLAVNGVQDSLLQEVEPAETTFTAAPGAPSSTTEIQVKEAHRELIVDLDHREGQEALTVAAGLTPGALFLALEAADGSRQSYHLTDPGGEEITGESTLETGDRLVVTAEDGETTAAYLITVAPSPGEEENGEEDQEPGDKENGKEDQEPGDKENGKEDREPGDKENGKEEQEPGDKENGEEGREPGDEENGGESQEPGDEENGEESQEPGDEENGKEGREPGDEDDEGQEPGDKENGKEDQEPGDKDDEGQEPGDKDDEGQEPGDGDEPVNGQQDKG